MDKFYKCSVFLISIGVMWRPGSHVVGGLVWFGYIIYLFRWLCFPAALHDDPVSCTYQSIMENGRSGAGHHPPASLMTRVGIGYDVHQFAEGRKLILGGVEIPHTHGLQGHSDADVLAHAIADAVLGALGLPDIGHYFPPSDASIEGISSLEILARCRELATEQSAVIGNIDSTLVAEAPKVLPFREQMRERIAAALGIEPARIGIKATTNETMGFVGRREGIAAMAVAAVELSEPS